MENILILAVAALILGLAAGQICKEKRAGVRWIGCPNGGKCSGDCGAKKL